MRTTAAALVADAEVDLGLVAQPVHPTGEDWLVSSRMWRARLPAEDRIDVPVRLLQRSVVACGLQHVQLPIGPPLQRMVDDAADHQAVLVALDQKDGHGHAVDRGQ